MTHPFPWELLILVGLALIAAGLAREDDRW